MMRLFRSRLFRALRREDGTASIEFVMFIPVVVMIFMASVESGFYMAKHVMMERGLDIVMRDVRLGKMSPITPVVLLAKICEASPMLNDCQSVVKIEMQPVSTATFALPTESTTCVMRGSSTQPETEFNPGGSNEIMLVRVCAIQDPMFPSTGIGLRLRADSLGGYQMIATSFFVNEPR